MEEGGTKWTIEIRNQVKDRLLEKKTIFLEEARK
jgi:hypothetical protein